MISTTVLTGLGIVICVFFAVILFIMAEEHGYIPAIAGAAFACAAICFAFLTFVSYNHNAGETTKQKEIQCVAEGGRIDALQNGIKVCVSKDADILWKL